METQIKGRVSLAMPTVLDDIESTDPGRAMGNRIEFNKKCTICFRLIRSMKTDRSRGTFLGIVGMSAC